MGAGRCGLFTKTYGSSRYSFSLSSIFVGNGHGSNLKLVASKIKEEPGFSDVVIHGNPYYVAYYRNNERIDLNQRSLSKMIKKDSGYKKGTAIRLVSCSTGKEINGFAQNLANKMGVVVKAPSDTLWVLPTGKMIIGETPMRNTGKWITYYPGGNKNEK